MESIYLIVFVCIIFAELTPKINTYGFLKQASLCLMAVGAMVSIAGHDNYFISIGIAIYLLHNIYYAMRKNRRREDRTHNPQ